MDAWLLSVFLLQALVRVFGWSSASERTLTELADCLLEILQDEQLMRDGSPEGKNSHAISSFFVVGRTIADFVTIAKLTH